MTKPRDWWTYHHKDCGIQYRGCHPDLCPKEQYERTGIWREDLVKPITGRTHIAPSTSGSRQRLYNYSIYGLI